MSFLRRIALLSLALVSLSWVPPINYVEVASYTAAGNCAALTDFNGARTAWGAMVTNATAGQSTVYCTVPIGPASVLPADLDFVRVVVNDLTTAGPITAKLCFRNLESTGGPTCGAIDETTQNSSGLLLYATPPSSWSGNVVAAFIDVRLPPHAVSSAEIVGYSLYTH